MALLFRNFRILQACGRYVNDRVGAAGRALKSLQQEVSSALAKSLAEHIYGNSPSDAVSPQAACPKS
jgi:protein involved in polysaccharide export with SLBB domain